MAKLKPSTRTKQRAAAMMNECESLIMSRIKGVLDQLYRAPQNILDLESADRYICTVCQTETKQCLIEPGFRCADALRGESELQNLEEVLDRLRRGTYGTCVSCGEGISTSCLRSDPSTQLCGKCAAKRRAPSRAE